MLITRRRLLSATALAGALAALPLGRAARALSLEEADEATSRLYLDACSNADREAHDELLREARARLDPRLDESEIRAELAKLTCPVCGCPLLPRE
jgi:hypothetical protein